MSNIFSSALDIIFGYQADKKDINKDATMENSKLMTKDEANMSFATKEVLLEKLNNLRDNIFTRLTWVASLAFVAVSVLFTYLTVTMQKNIDEKFVDQNKIVDSKLQIIDIKIQSLSDKFDTKFDSQSSDIKSIKESLAKLSNKK